MKRTYEKNVASRLMSLDVLWSVLDIRWSTLDIRWSALDILWMTLDDLGVPHKQQVHPAVFGMKSNLESYERMFSIAG